MKRLVVVGIVLTVVMGILLTGGFRSPGLAAQDGPTPEGPGVQSGPMAHRGFGPQGGPMGGFGRGPSGMGREGREGLRLLALLESDQVKAALGLSEQQADRLREIMLNTAKATVKTRADLEVHGIELAEMLRVDKPDHDAVLKKAQEISDLRGQMMKQHLGALLAAKDVLTPEQQKKIRSFIGGHLAQGAGWGGRPEGRGGPMGRPPRPPAPPQAPPQPRNE